MEAIQLVHPSSKNKQNKKVISEMTMPNQHVRKLIANFPIITTACFDTSIEEEKNSKESWDSSVALWRIVTEMVRKREDFSEEDIEEFQVHCDNFTHQWLCHIQIQRWRQGQLSCSYVSQEMACSTRRQSSQRLYS